MQERKLSNFGYSFQTKLIASIMTDPQFTSRVYDLVDEEYFESEAIKLLINVGLDYFKQYKKLPTLDVYKVSIDSIKDELLKKEVVSSLRSAVKNVEATDIDFVKKSTIKFCKDQKLKIAILDSVDDLNKGDYDMIYSRITEAMKVGLDGNIGTEYFKHVERRYTLHNRNTTTTGWDIVDDLMKGGLAKGEFGMFIAPSGAGKSFLLTHLGAAALKAKKKVIHYTLELDESSVSKRYDSILTGISLDKLTGPNGADYISDVESRLKEYSVEGGIDNLVVKEFPTKGVGLMGLRSHLQKLQMLGFEPDLIIIDYVDLLSYKANSNQPRHIILGELYEEIRGFAKEFNVPLWSVSQSNKDGLSDDIIEAGSAAGAYAKIYPADFIASLSRKANDKVSNTGRVHIIKNRFGPDGMTFPAYVDTSRAIIRIYDDDTSDAKELRGKMKTNDEYDRERLKHRMLQISGKKVNTTDKKSLF